MSHTGLIFIAIVIGAGLLLVAGKSSKRGGSSAFHTKARAVLTKNEQGLYLRLREAFPDQVVLAQVAFSALITSDRAHRNRYSQKVADFVLCDKAFSVRVVIELDDSSHAGRGAEDAARDGMLKRAGYTVLRVPRTPDVEAIKRAVADATNAAPGASEAPAGAR
jgi:very-short-patch-repair endonuclease